MRRFRLIALTTLLALSACSTDDSTKSPTESGPEAVTAPRCRPAPFPIASLTTQIIKIFPVTGGLQANALIRAVAIGAYWTVCKPTDAQKGVAAFVKWMTQQFQANKLIGGTGAQSGQRVTALTNSLYSAVGLTPPNVPPGAVGGGDVGVEVFTGPQLLVKTINANAGTQIPANSFTEPTVITIFKRVDNPFPATVSPPIYEITASNASGTHSLTGTLTALVGFCVDDDLLSPPHTPAIAHLLSEGFEILPSADTGPLGLDCDPFVPPAPFVVGAAGFGTLQDLALSNLRNAGRQIGTVAQALFLPEPLHATAAAGKSGLGGLARSLSPFGVTDRDQISPLPCSQEGTIKSLNSDSPVNVTFVNNTTQNVSVFWLDFDGLRDFPFEGGGIGVPYAVLAPGQSYVQATFVTHPWILIGADESCYGIFLPRPNGGTVIVP